MDFMILGAGKSMLKVVGKINFGPHKFNTTSNTIQLPILHEVQLMPHQLNKTDHCTKYW
jgi:hypothetical protein